MLYYIADYLQKSFHVLNVVHYVSFRSIASLLSTLFMALVFGDFCIAKLAQVFRSKAREYTPETHKAKDDLPTMGGIFILGLVLINCFLWTDFFNPMVLIFLAAMVGFGAIGFWDDWQKVRYNRGISAKAKFIAQWGVAAGVVIAWVGLTGASTQVVLPFFKNLTLSLGVFFVIWAMFIMVSLSNAVNLTDGLDGLAIVSLLPNFVLFSLICYLAGHIKLASYLQIPFAGTAEIAVVGSTLIGACLGFLWFNTYPAQVFMGDVGSLALGASLAFMALMAKQELLLVLSGGLFVLETLSVMMQVFVFKRWGRRLFKMAPIHHHFELLGWPESKITMRFAIISLVLCLLALITLKLR